MQRRARAGLGLFSSFVVLAPASFAQTYSLDTNCSMDTFLRHGDKVLGSRVVDCTAAGVTHEITPADSGSNFSDFVMAVSVRLDRPSSDLITVTMRGRALSTFASKPIPAVTADAHVQLSVRPHALPFNQDYLLQVDGNVGASWTRAGTGGLGSAGTGITIVNCPGKVITVGSGDGASGTLSKTESIRCVLNTGNSFGFLSDVGASLNARAVAQDGTSNEASAEAVYTIQVKRAGPEMRPLTGPQETVAGLPLPQAIQVVVVQNDTDAPLPGHSVEFRLKDASGGILDTLTRTTLVDGKAAANFTIPAGGNFSVEAVCTACVSGQTAVFPIKALSGELAALPGPREGPVRGTVELAFKATERVLVGGAVQNNPIAGTPVSFTVTGPAGDAALSPNPATTGQDGAARTTMMLGSVAGTYVVTANCAACRARPMAQVNINATQSAIALVKDANSDPMAGDGQKAFVGDFLPLKLRVKLQAGGVDRPQVGVPVEFVVVPPSGAKGAWTNPGTTTTDSSGKAVTVLTLGAQPGIYLIRAICPTCTANQEVQFTATAKPIPTFVAGFLSDFGEGPLVAIRHGAPSKLVLGDGSFTTLNVTATGQPENLRYQWSIRSGADKVEFAGGTTGNQVALRPKAQSGAQGDVELLVEYGDPTDPSQVMGIVHRLTIQRPTALMREKARKVACSDPIARFPGVVKKWEGPNGSETTFQYRAFDQFDSPLGILPNQTNILFAESGRMKSVTHPGFQHLRWGVGVEVSKGDVLREGGRFVDTIGFCSGEPYPPGFTSVFDRCIFVGGLRIQREEATFSVDDAAIITSGLAGCPL